MVGIGDMSGDVFGNGMLLSEHIRLVAAFDHRHIFIDPTPDAGQSFVERRRLFDLPRSSWDDYDRVADLGRRRGLAAHRQVDPDHGRDARRRSASTTPASTALTPAELMRAILQAPVDLLWNGGIGTYVKATDESRTPTSATRPTTRMRVNGGQLRATVVGEGGNLGLTQRGRVEYALRAAVGQRRRGEAHICTDFIDNSAGVDCSDHEVNIKILLGARGGRRRADAGRARRAAGRDDRRGRRAGAAGQLRPGHRARRRPGPGRTRCCRCTGG